MPDPAPADRIRARTDPEAKRRFFKFLQQSLSAVHRRAIWRAVAVPRQEGQWSAVTAPPVIPLSTSNGSRLYLRATIRFEYVDNPDPDRAGERKVATREYVYTVGADEDLRTELYSWQWQPGAWNEPHVHVGRRHPDYDANLGKLHIPTGRVALEQVLKFLITDPSRRAGPGP